MFYGLLALALTREAVRRSKGFAAERLAKLLGDIDLSDIWQILIAICEEIALYFGGGMLLGGGIAGSFAGGVGAVPGALIGAGVGAKAGGWILALLGLKSLVEGLGDSLPRAIECYRSGFLETWGPGPKHSLKYRPPTGTVFFAAQDIAEGHVILILSLLSAMIAYLTRGRGNRSQILKEIRESPSLGPKMANWLEKNEAKLRDHPLLKPKPPEAAPMAQSAHPVKPRSGPALTPSQLRAERQAPRPKDKSDSQRHIDSATKQGDNVAVPRVKPINLPSWKKIEIDIDHIASGHMKGGSRVSSRKNMFPEDMTKSQVEKSVRQAYRYGERVKTQGDRVLVRGNNVEMWVNTKTNTIETAYPIK